MANLVLTRILITLTVSTINLFFKIKKAKVNKIFRKIDGGRGREREGTAAFTLLKQSGPGKTSWTCVKCNKYFYTQDGLKHVANFDQLPIEHEAKSKLPQVDLYVKLYHIFLRVFYWYLLVKNICRCMLKHGTFARWRYLDCFLPGRVTLNGRTIEMAPYFVLLETSGWLLWSRSIERLVTDIRMPCVEFLLDRAGSEPYWRREESSFSWNRANERTGQFNYSTLLEYRNFFSACRGHTSAVLYKMRPNRTRASWHSLAQLTNWCYGGAIFSCLLFVPFFLRMFLPVVLTRRGFKSNYRLCIEWIATTRVQAINSTESYAQSPSGTIADLIYSSIWPPNADAHELGAYTKPEVIRDLFMPWVDIVSPSYFQLLRASLDMLESMLLYTTLGLTFNSVCFISILMSRDILIYCQSINTRLKRLVRVASAQQSWSRSRSRFLRDDTADVQAQIVDMFAMLDSYNRYMSIQCTGLLIFWLCYSAMVSSWIFLPGNDSPKVEWYTMHAVATVFFFSMLSNTSKVRSGCHEMHELMSSAMARACENYNRDNGQGEGNQSACDDGDGGCAQDTRKIWIALMKFYKPRPLYCFTIINSVELTVMSGLQLLAWLFGALVIASSFFQVHNIK